jgi:hypothetical protein
MSERALKQRCDEIAERIQQAYASYEGHAVRVDSGDAGMIYVALRDARRQPELGERLGAKLEALLEEEIDGESEELDFAISLGSGNRDLLLQVEVRYV